MPETKPRKRPKNNTDGVEMALVRKNQWGGYDLFFPTEQVREGLVAFYNEVDGHGEADLDYMYECTEKVPKREADLVVARYEAYIRSYPNCGDLCYAAYVSLPRNRSQKGKVR